MKQIIGINFDEEAIKSINREDGVYSIIYYVYHMIMLLLFALLQFKTQVYKNLGSHSRIQGLIKNKWISIIVVGILFGIMHVPFKMIEANMSLVDFLLYDMLHLIITCLMHIYFVYLYTRDNNILAPTIAHTK